jgi:predicted adenylyl cyclase CyaB
MGLINIEIKARCNDPDFIEKILKDENAKYIGTDHQTDTYFKTKTGRLKLREGNIENALIYYEREDRSGPKKSDVVLYKTEHDSALKELLTKSLGIKVIVKKKRKIFFIHNVKFHIDEVKNLGYFLEIEAIDEKGTIGKEKLLEQCKQYLAKFHIKSDDLISNSYSDMLLKE